MSRPFGTGPLPAVDDLALARRVLADYEPPDERQADFRARMLAWIDAHPEDAHLRSCLAGHLTASCLLLDHAGERALLTHHRKLGRWLQLGGHCDGDANLRGVALREAVEESGIAAIEIDAAPVDLDVHTIPARPGEPEHLHLDTRYLARCAPGSRPRAGAESIELAWLAPEQLERVPTDDSVRRLFRLAFPR